MPEYLSCEGDEGSPLRVGMRIDWYTVERRARNWGKGRSRAASRRRRARAVASRRTVYQITGVNPVTRTVTVAPYPW